MDKRDLLLEQWKTASEIHRHEDNLTWQKFNYFVAVNGLLLSVLIVNWKDLASSSNLREVGLSTSIFGAFISVVWFLVQWRGALYQMYWIRLAKKAEEDLGAIDKERVLSVYQFGLNDKGQKIVKVPFPAKLPTQLLIIGLGFILSVAWVCLSVYFYRM